MLAKTSLVLQTSLIHISCQFIWIAFKWEAAKIAKDQNIDDLPDDMNIDGKPIPKFEIAEEFAKMFEQKVKDIESTTNVNDGVYNGNRKINEQNKNFMTSADVRKAILSLKLKNSEGFDRIPQRILLDGISVLMAPFEIIYEVTVHGGCSVTVLSSMLTGLVHVPRVPGLR